MATEVDTVYCEALQCQICQDNKKVKLVYMDKYFFKSNVTLIHTLNSCCFTAGLSDTQI